MHNPLTPRVALGVLAVGLLSLVPLPAQEGAAQPPDQAADTAAEVKSNWITRCTGPTRGGALDCSVEQSIVTKETAQIVALFRIRLPQDAQVPAMMVQLPLGLFLPAGLELQVDEHEPLAFPVQTCDAAGCYVGATVSTELLGQLESGTTLRLGFQDLTQSQIDVRMPLANFASAYQAIK